MYLALCSHSIFLLSLSVEATAHSGWEPGVRALRFKAAPPLPGDLGQAAKAPSPVSSELKVGTMTLTTSKGVF